MPRSIPFSGVVGLASLLLPLSFGGRIFVLVATRAAVDAKTGLERAILCGWGPHKLFINSEIKFNYLFKHSQS